MVSALFYTPSDISGHLICWISGKPYDHCAIVHDVAGNPHITQALKYNGVCCWPVTTLSKHVAIELPWVDEAWALKWLSMHWSGHYGWLDLLLFPFKSGLNLKNDHGLICSELVILFLQAAIRRTPAPYSAAADAVLAITDASRISPGAAYDLLTKLQTYEMVQG